MKKILGIIVLGLLWCTTSYSNNIMQDLIDTLVDTNKPKSIKVANFLKIINNNGKSYDLVIRKANLNINDVKNIASVIKKTGQNNGPKLRTISMNFKGNLKDEGVIEILNHLPLTTLVIAFVECELADKVGQTIID
jgi:hypothetical protein